MLRIKWVPFIFLLVLVAFLVPGKVSAAPDTLPKISISYYYNNPCDSCNEESKFYDKFNALVGKDKEGIALEFSFLNVFRTSDQEKFLHACDKYGIPEDKRITPMVIVNDKPLIGENAIDSNLESTFAEEKQKVLQQSAANSSKVSRLVYFYVSPCEDCAEVKNFLDSLPATLTVIENGQKFESSIIIDSYNVAEAKNLELVTQYFKDYDMPDEKQKVPVIFLRDGYLSGKDEIINELTVAIKSGRAIGNSQIESSTELQPYEWPGIFLTGLINGFNPCSISMLLFLVTILLTRKANVLKLGLLFIFGKLIAYLALGTILFNILSLFDDNIIHLFTGIMKYVLLAVTLSVAAVNINDCIASRFEKYNKIRLQLPLRLRKFNHELLKSVNHGNGIILLVTTVVLGMLISVGEFLCTGQIYLATILYLLKRSPELNLQMLFAFLIYILGMLLPLVIVTIAVHKGREVFNISELARKNMPVIKLINSVVFLAFAIIIIVLF